MNNWIPKPTFPINYRPASLFLYYKYFPFGGDTIIGLVYFYKNGTVIGNPYFGTTQTVSTWTPLEIPMTYNTADVPDSASILFVTGAYVQHSESILYIDNLSFPGFINSVPENSNKQLMLNMYPNPATDVVHFEFAGNDNNNVLLNFYNLTGTLVKSEKLKKNTQQMNMEKLVNGVYWVEVISDEGIEKHKLVIQK